ncbi:hypothetical protein SAMN04488522_105399 [Pedobacter caeni]|uniref:Uncharacterized protein n=2 Tax=Pedobacter caeni TaxID=288992 RepID=A0A1M5JKJ5_9SPHI|nr:hypothetical protein SAMN04488522_105399 [Pedobacter caeni]
MILCCSLIFCLQQTKAQRPSNVAVLKEHTAEQDLPVNEYLVSAIKPIKANYNKLNSIAKWQKVKRIDLDFSSEGGEAKFYYLKNGLQKMVVRQFAEMSQKLSEYYLMQGKLSFVYETEMRYKSTLETKDAEVVSDRFYFAKGKLFHLINSEDCGAPFSSDYMKGEEERIFEEYNQLRKLSLEK